MSVQEQHKQAPPQDAWTPRKVASWLRRYRDWKAELAAGPRSRSVTDYTRPVVMGGKGGLSGAGGDALAHIERSESLAQSIRTVEAWLESLSPLEKQAADYYLQDTDGTITAMAMVAGLEYQSARHLVHALPLIIWGRFYHGS